MAHGIKQVTSFLSPNMKGKDEEKDGAAVIEEKTKLFRIFFWECTKQIANLVWQET